MDGIKTYKNSYDGFTIVETLIVLAIAAVVITIVLLAVPALQNNSRNSDIKNDAAAVAAAIEDFETNTTLKPLGLSFSDGVVQICSCTSCTSVEGICTNVVGATASVQASDTVKPVGTSGLIPYNSPMITEVGPGTLDIDFGTQSDGYTCYSTNALIPTSKQGYAEPAGASSQIPIYYPVETGSTPIGIMCTQA